MSLRYAVRELTVRRHRTFVNCLGIAVAVALIISLFSLSEAYRAAVRTPFEGSGVDVVAQKPNDRSVGQSKVSGVTLPDSAAPLTKDEVGKLKKLKGIDKMAVSLQVWSFDPGRFKVIEGVDPENPNIGPLRFREWIAKGRFFKAGDKGVAVAEKHFAKFYGLRVGDPIDISGEIFKLIGTVEVKNSSQLTSANLFLPIDEVRRLSGIDSGSVNGIYIHLNKAASSVDVVEAIRKAVPGIKVTSPDSSLATADSLFRLSQQYTWLIAVIVIIVAAFLILKTAAANILERTREIGIMKAVGWTKYNVSRQLFLEMLIQGLLGAAIGIAAGIFGSVFLSGLKVNAPLPWQGSPIPNTIGSSAADAGSVPLHIAFSPLLLLAVFATAVILTLVSGMIASRKAVSTKPAATLRHI
jgi:putative ABC transport system permease protein